MKTRQMHLIGALGLLLSAAGLAWVGQPDPMQKWQFMAPTLEPQLVQRQVQIDPAELLGLMHNDYVALRLIDVRHERDWNLFHLWGAEHIPREALLERYREFTELPANSVIVLVSNDEAEATEAWKLLMAAATQPNAYILAGGINRWLAEYADPVPAGRAQDAAPADDTLRFPIQWAMGSRHPAALPELHEAPDDHRIVKKVKLQQRVVKKGGCG